MGCICIYAEKYDASRPNVNKKKESYFEVKSKNNIHLGFFFFFWIEDSEGREASFFLFHQQMILISAEALSSDLRKFVPESLSLRVLRVWNYVYCVNFRRDCSFSETNTTLSFPELLFFPIHLSFLIGKWAHPFCHCWLRLDSCPSAS